MLPSEPVESAWAADLILADLGDDRWAVLKDRQGGLPRVLYLP